MGENRNSTWDPVRHGHAARRSPITYEVSNNYSVGVMHALEPIRNGEFARATQRSRGRLAASARGADRKTRCPRCGHGILKDGETLTVTSGVSDIRTGEPVTPDTRFLIASLTKHGRRRSRCSSSMKASSNSTCRFATTWRTSRSPTKTPPCARRSDICYRTPVVSRNYQGESLESFVKGLFTARQIHATGDAWSYSSGADVVNPC
jgi:Beta-lactamase